MRMSKSDAPLISVIVPIFNSEKYLKDCVSSILSQTYQNLEIILVNDGSTDLSGIICEQLKKSDSRIKTYHQENSGVSVARNNGLRNATGEFVAFVDSDDILPFDAYENMMKNASESVDMIIGKMGYIDADGNPLKESRNFETKTISKIEFLFDLMEEQKYGYLGYPWDKLFRLLNIQKNKIEFKPEIKVNEDRVFIFEYVKQSKIIQTCDNVVYSYRQRSEDVINSAGRRIVLSDAELTVINAFNQLKMLSSDISQDLYIICARKAFESSIDMLQRVKKKDVKNIKIIQNFLRENATILLKQSNLSRKDKAKIFLHKVLKR